jgi:hypothetical protein
MPKRESRSNASWKSYGRILMLLAPRLANKHYLKVADLAALKGDYYKAIENFERVARSSVNNHLMKWSVKDYFLKAGMCHLATKVPARPPFSASTPLFRSLTYMSLRCTGSRRHKPSYPILQRS